MPVFNTTFTNLSAAFTIDGDSAGDRFGISVSGIGDINGDGFRDFLAGADRNDNNGTESGSVTVFSGADGTVLFNFNGDNAGDRVGYSATGAGDVNGDGINDIIVGAFGDDNNGSNSGSARVFSGADGTVLFTFNGDDAGDFFGTRVSGGGDFNNDGFADLVVSATLDDNNGTDTGSARVLSGEDGTILFTFDGINPDDRFGYSIGSAGDINGDGFDDVIVGAPGKHAGLTTSGSVRIFSGDDGSTLFTFNGDNIGDRFGLAVSGAGDVNNDGVDDVIIGAFLDDNTAANSGSATVFSGVDGSVLYTFNGTSSGDRFGISVAGAGDVNGDGFDDVIIGADQHSNGSNGLVEIRSGFDGSLLFTASGDGSGDVFGGSLSSAGDVNNDGFADLIVGSLTADNNGTDSGFARLFTSTGTGALDSTRVYVEGTAAVVLDDDVAVADAVLDALNGGNGDYQGTSLNIERQGGANEADVFGFADMANVTVNAGNLEVAGNAIATFTNSSGVITISFTNANGGTPTTALINEIIKAVTFRNTDSSLAPGQVATLPLDWTFSDGTNDLIDTINIKQSDQNVVSDFASDLDGWGIGANGTNLTFQAAGGNPEGNIRATDGGTGIWFFDAPDKFLGDKSIFFDGNLSFDLKVSNGTLFVDEDVTLVGGGLTIVYDAPLTPTTTFTSYTVTLNELEDWRVGTLAGDQATTAEIQTVLANLTSLQIRGDHIDGSDSANLDNVSLETGTRVDQSSAKLIASRFGEDTEGWSAIGDVQAISYQATGGNPDGFFQATDAALGSFWFNRAPQKFLGDKSSFFGGTIDYEIKQSSVSNPAGSGEHIKITGGGLSIVLDFPTNPLVTFTHYTANLDETSDWRIDNIGGTIATAAQIQTVLGDVIQLLIRGEFRTGPDTGGLDNVVIATSDAIAAHFKLFDTIALASQTAAHDEIEDALAIAGADDALVVANAAGAGNAGPVTVNSQNLTIIGDAPFDAALSLSAGIFNFTLLGTSDASIAGNSAANLLTAGDGNNSLFGRSGNDTLIGGLGDDILDGGGGNDTASYAGFTGALNVNLNPTGPQLTGAGNDTLINIENLSGGSGVDRFVGKTGATGGDNVLSGEGGNDQLYGIGGNDTLNGGDDNDFALGGAGEDSLNGNNGDDILKGGNDNDTLTGGIGRDLLFGQAGADTFVFNDIAESGLVYVDRDIIRDFSQADGDLIDLSGIDAVTGGADDAFIFLGTVAAPAFTNVAGQLFAVNTAGGQTVVWGDVDGDGVQDFTFVLDGALALTDSDFIL